MPDDQRTQDRLMLLLKTRGPLTTKQLADRLEISVPAVRGHLASVGDQVTVESRSTGVGRPSQFWSLTEKAAKRFPDGHSEMTVRLISLVQQELGEQALQQVVQAQHQVQLKRYQQGLSNVKSVAAKLKRLAQLRTDEGYMAELLERENGWALVEHHCPICAAAEACQGFCQSELTLFQQILGDDVVVRRSEYLLAGGQRCVYEIVPA